MTLYLGIDPSVRRSAIGIWRDGQAETTIESHVVGPVEQLAASPVVHKLAEGLPKIYALIERPSWGGYGTKEVRAAAIAWERLLNSLFPDRRVFYIDPRSWQAVMHKNCPGDTTKERSLWFCRNGLKLDFGGDHDRADAACIAYYARRFHAADNAAKQLAGQQKKARRRVS